jgi:hypothetical protein
MHARELVLLVYRFAIGKVVEVRNPAESIQRKTIATFKTRERNLNHREAVGLQMLANSGTGKLQVTRD